MKVILKNVRLSSPSLYHTEVYNGEDTGKYACTLLLHKENDAAQIEALKKAAQDVLNEKYGIGKIPKGFKMPFVDGDEKEYDGYEGHISIKASTKRRPTTIDKNKTPVVEEDGVFYAGCRVNASVSAWVMDNNYGKKVLFSLNGVQFNRHDAPFGSDGDSSDDFDVIADDDDLLA